MCFCCVLISLHCSKMLNILYVLRSMTTLCFLCVWCILQAAVLIPLPGHTVLMLVCCWHCKCVGVCSKEEKKFSIFYYSSLLVYERAGYVLSYNSVGSLWMKPQREPCTEHRFNMLTVEVCDRSYVMAFSYILSEPVICTYEIINHYQRKCPAMCHATWCETPECKRTFLYVSRLIQ